MPVLSQIVTVPKNTLEASPFSDDLTLMVGKLNLLEIGFQDGCANLVKIALFYRLKQIVPFIEGTTLQWNDHIFSIPMDLSISSSKEVLRVSASSQGTLYPHDIYFWLYFDTSVLVQKTGVIDSLLSLVPTRKVAK